MAASINAERSPEVTTPLKTPKTEVPSPESEELSDSNQYQSNPSTPNRFSPLDVGSGSTGRTAASSSSSNSFTACRGMSWTPSETNALIAVWGNERLTEARMQQLEVAGTVFSGKAPGPAMYERVSRALAELGYERTPSQCRERMKVRGQAWWEHRDQNLDQGCCNRPPLKVEQPQIPAEKLGGSHLWLPHLSILREYKIT